MDGITYVYHIQTMYKYIDYTGRENVRDSCALNFDHKSYMNSRYVRSQTLWSRIQTDQIENVVMLAKMMSEDTHIDMKNKEAYDFNLRIAIIKDCDSIEKVDESDCEFGFNFDIGLSYINTITVQIIYMGDVITSSNKLYFNRGDRLLGQHELFDEDKCYHDDFSYQRGNLKRIKRIKS